MRILRTLLVTLVLVMPSALAETTPKHAIAAGGPVTFPSSSDAFVCNTVHFNDNLGIVPGDVEIVAPIPAVGRSADTAGGGNQLVQDTVTLREILGDGSTRQVSQPKTFSETATPSTPAFSVSKPKITFRLQASSVYRIDHSLTWSEARGDVIARTTVSNRTPLRIKQDGNVQSEPSNPLCIPAVRPTLFPLQSDPSGTVNTWSPIILSDAHLDGPPFPGGTVIQFDGVTVIAETLPPEEFDDQFVERGRFRVPASTAGPHTVRAFRADGRPSQNSFVFTVIPRIKVTPSPSARGETVDVSLRGFGAGESVRIRWFDGTRFVTLVTVVTSSTGSKNVAVPVPRFAPNGTQKIRGDGTTNAAQTNVFEVQGGAFQANSKPKPTAIATQTSTPTITPSPEATDVPTIEVTAETTIEPPATATSTPEPTIESSPEPTFEPTATATEPSPPVEPSPATPEVEAEVGGQGP